MPNDLDDLQATVARWQDAIHDVARSIAITGGSLVAERAVSAYMRDAGQTGPPFDKRNSVSGPLRILSGRLARSLTGAGGRTGGVQGIRNVTPNSVGSITPGGLGTRDFPVPGSRNDLFRDESINRLENTANGVRLVKGSKVPYAGVHEDGFSGMQTVRQHTRTTPSGTQTVSAHQRFMQIPARPFLSPALSDVRSEIAEMAEEQLVNLTLETNG